MSIAVAGRWELEWNTPIKEMDLWNLMLRDFAVKNWFMWPISGIKNSESAVSLHERENMSEVLNDKIVKDYTRVYFEPYNPIQLPEAGEDLRFFKHPEDALYIFGSAHYNPVGSNKTEKDKVVQVPTVKNKGVLWPTQCLAICLYDRLVKEKKGEKIDFKENF